MAKFYGKIGFEETRETSPSVWTPDIVERPYAGDLMRNYRQLENGVGTNDNISLSNEISIVADPYAVSHFHSMRYVYFNGSRWKITGVTVEFPRLRLTIGGLYNGPTATSA